MLRFLQRFALPAVAVVLMAAACGPNDASGLVGTDAPDITVSPVLPKGDVRLSSLKGKVVVLDFWATYCGPCKMLMPELVRIQDKYRKDGLVVMGISAEGSEFVKPFHEANPRLGYDLFLDPGASASTTYKASAIPTTVLVGKDGKVAYYEQGYSELGVVDLEKKIQEELAKA